MSKEKFDAIPAKEIPDDKWRNREEWDASTEEWWRDFEDKEIKRLLEQNDEIIKLLKEILARLSAEDSSTPDIPWRYY
jgi:hypothetical protein